MDSSRRYAFLDLYRGLIVVFMLEGHLVRQLMGMSWQEGAVFRAHELFHGMTAPGFLFGAGFTFAIATQRKAHLLRGLSRPFFRRLWRGILLIIVGYALHLPYLSVSKSLSEAGPEAWEAFLQFDVLQLIGLSLVLLRLLYLVARDDRHFLAYVTAAGVLIVVLTPSVWHADAVRSGSIWWTTALAGWYGSPFPIFPNLAFVLAGVVASWGFLRAKRDDVERSYMHRLLTFGAAMVVVAWGLDQAPWTLSGTDDFWTTGPGFFWMRLGVLLVAMGGLWFLEERVVGSPTERWLMPSWLTTLGVESLFVYVAHLLLLYGSVVNPAFHLTALLGRDLTPLEATVCVPPFIVAGAMGARWWHRLKKQHAPWMQMAYWWMGLSVAGELLLRAY